ncbi:hypothetical protein GCM10023172_00070 [Hymenobacter ginsengisoli]|uniref:Uncharacterized protein n=1 Tax=Hymenobacter ginsengisoli TaxID=1051626 RepID=A0ABP8PWN1_9BACT
MNVFSYAELYPIWQRATEQQARADSVLVYFARLIRLSSVKIVWFKAPAFCLTELRGSRSRNVAKID